MKTTLKKLVGRFLVAFSCWGAISLCQQYAYAGETTQEKVLRDATVCIYRASDLTEYFDKNGQPKEEFEDNLPPRYTGIIIGKQKGGAGVVMTSPSPKLVDGTNTDRSKAWWIVLQPVYDDQGEAVEKVYAMSATPIAKSGEEGLLFMSIPSDNCKDEKGKPRYHLPEKFPNFQTDDSEKIKGGDYSCLTYSADETDPEKVKQVQSFLGWLRKSIFEDDGSVKLNQVFLHYDDGSNQGFLSKVLDYMNAEQSRLTVKKVDERKIIHFSRGEKNFVGAAVYSERTNNVVGLLNLADGSDLQACPAGLILTALKYRSNLSEKELDRITGGTEKETQRVGGVGGGGQDGSGIRGGGVQPGGGGGITEGEETRTTSFNFDKDTIIYGAIGLLGVVLIIVLVLLFRSKSAAGEGAIYEYDAPTVVMPRGEGGADKSTPVMRLVGEDGTSYGVTYDELKRGVSLGRGSVADKVFSNETVSRKHVIIFRKHGRAFVEDCGSSGGTILNGVKLEPNKPALITRKTSDLKLANYTVRVVIVMDQN